MTAAAPILGQRLVDDQVLVDVRLRTLAHAHPRSSRPDAGERRLEHADALASTLGARSSLDLAFSANIGEVSPRHSRTPRLRAQDARSARRRSGAMSHPLLHYGLETWRR